MLKQGNHIAIGLNLCKKNHFPHSRASSHLHSHNAAPTSRSQRTPHAPQGDHSRAANRLALALVQMGRPRPAVETPQSARWRFQRHRGALAERARAGASTSRATWPSSRRPRPTTNSQNGRPVKSTALVQHDETILKRKGVAV